MIDDYVPLDRTFHPLPPAEDGEAYDIRKSGSFGRQLTWPDLLKEPRVVILSEAGAGKTVEIREAARRLRVEQKSAFFVRLEHASQAFDDAFEEGDSQEFRAWIEGTGEGWLFLDSVDEARLRSPRDFDLAIRSVAARLATAMARAHVIVTSRPHAWRPRTDLALCERWLPYSSPEEVATAKPTPPSGKAAAANASHIRRPEAGTDSSYTIVALNDLTSDQIRTFAAVRGVPDVDAFMEAVERADAWPHTTRPQDLDELIGFWQESGGIGRRIDLMRASVRRRLGESDPNRAEARPLPLARAQSGARSVAAACTLARTPTVQVPGGSAPGAVNLADLLTDWTEVDQATLLSRPIFDEAIYGGVRFHHRSVREYLAAEWLSELLRGGASRSHVEQILFRDQYGLEVIVPETRPLLPWLAILDERICVRVQRLAPEVFFEGGDPSALPLTARRQILGDIVRQTLGGPIPHSLIDSAGIERFASAELGPDVKALLAQHAGNGDVEWLLLRMAWRGRLIETIPEVKAVALNPAADRYARTAAFRALESIGSPGDLDDVRRAFLGEAQVLDRDWLGELLARLPATAAGLDWLFEALAKTACRAPHGADNLTYAMDRFVQTLPADLLPVFVDRAVVLLDLAPLEEDKFCDLSKRHGWLLKAAAAAVLRLGRARRPETLTPAALSIFERVPAAHDYDRGDVGDVKPQLADLVGAWPDLNWALFWRAAERDRQRRSAEGEASLDDARMVRLWPSFVRFASADFDRALAYVAKLTTLEDRVLALTLAFSCYVDAGRPARARRRLWAAVAGTPALEAKLSLLMKPPPATAEVRRYRNMNAVWQRRAKLREAKIASDLVEAKRYLEEHVETAVRSPELTEPDAITRAQLYLIERARDPDSPTDGYARNGWRALIPQYGEVVARAFRDAAVAFWRRGHPRLVSEGAPMNSTPYATVFGLVGITIESEERPDWLASLTAEEANLAFRYAMHELNGFPAWLPQIAERYPDLIRDLALTEIRFELSTGCCDHNTHYLLSDLSWSGQWLWDDLGPLLLGTLAAAEPDNLNNLRYALVIVQGSAIGDDALARVAADKAHLLINPNHAAIWFAVWAGVAPGDAIPALQARLASIPVAEEATEFAMSFVTHLIGSRFSRAAARGGYKAAAHLKALYLLISRYVRSEDDLERAGKGVYSPTIRDEAQEARNALFSMLRELPGKEAFVAMNEIAREHPDPEMRRWALRHAATKATQDANGDPWIVSQVREFSTVLERSPATHRELFDLAVLRFEDLKAELEEGDDSDAAVLLRVQDETELRGYLGGRLRRSAHGRYAIPQEEELADARRPDLRFHHAPIDAPVPAELKLSHGWSLRRLFERLETQVCGGYLRDLRSSRGLMVIVHQGKQKHWDLPDGSGRVDFEGLVQALEAHWVTISDSYPGVDEIKILGIDLTKRGAPAPRRRGRASGGT